MKNNNKEKIMDTKRTNRKEISKIVELLKSIDCFKSEEEEIKEKEIQSKIEKNKKAKG
ncbi:TPA: hypothetical protein NHK58_001427 [Pseudomonas aeruginosa]|nr:hypothetical protein [Pseudomonas aeruginosa]